jgi:hypothetical protein
MIEEAEVEVEIKDPAKGKAQAEARPKSPNQPTPQNSSWEDLADEEDPLGPTEIHSQDQSKECQTVSKKKKNLQAINDVMTQSHSGSLK